MGYNPLTDFLGLSRLTGGGVRAERMPGLDYVVAALARLKIFSVWVGSAPPVSNFPTTVWVLPASPSWTNEASVFLYNTVTAEYEVATPALWAALFALAATPQLQTILGQQRILITRPVNFNVVGDTVFPIAPLPIGFTRFEVDVCAISGASGTLTTATAGLFTAAGGAGVQIVTAGTAITVNTANDATNNNAQHMTVNNSGSEAYAVANTPNLYYRVANPQGVVGAAANVSIAIVPVP